MAKAKPESDLDELEPKKTEEEIAHEKITQSKIIAQLGELLGPNHGQIKLVPLYVNRYRANVMAGSDGTKFESTSLQGVMLPKIAASYFVKLLPGGEIVTDPPIAIKLSPVERHK